MKHTNKIGALMLSGMLLATVSCSDFNDYNSEPGYTDASATRTLWENISADPTLSDFAAALSRVGYDKILNTPNAYTVWAPVNGSFDKDSLAEVTDEKVLKEFVKNHIANYYHAEGDVNDTVIYMLNGKLLKFTNKNTADLEFDGKKINFNPEAGASTVHNQPSTNGMLYSMTAPAEFRMNLYDYMYELEGISDSLSNLVKKYDVKILDEANSIKGAIVDGIQTYDDEVYVYGNSLFCNYKLNNRAYRSRYNCALNDEDSLYMMVIPTNEAWDEARTRMSKYYNYVSKYGFQDMNSISGYGGTYNDKSNRNNAVLGKDKGVVNYTLKTDAAVSDVPAYYRDSMVTRFLSRDLVYSLTNKRYNQKIEQGSDVIDNDSIYSTSRQFHSGIDSLRRATIEEVKLSNGYARIVNSYPYQSWENSSYAPEIKSLVLARCEPAYHYEYKMVRKSQIPSSIGTLEDGETSLTYIKAKSRNGDDGTSIEFDFYLPDVLSTSYNVYVVTVPACLEDPNAVKKECRFIADLNYYDGNNMVAGRFDPNSGELKTGSSAIKSVKAVNASAEKIDTVFLGKVDFPVCYKGVEGDGNQIIAPNIKFMLSERILKSDPSENEYEHLFRIANVILRPVEYDEYKKSSKTE